MPSPNDGVYMHPQILALGLKLPLTPFVCGVLAYYRVLFSVPVADLTAAQREPHIRVISPEGR